MKNLHINNSYNIWNPIEMNLIIKDECLKAYNSNNPEETLGRSYSSMYIEWWLHNIGYYVTKFFCYNKKINAINLRCKDVDLEEHVYK